MADVSSDLETQAVDVVAAQVAADHVDLQGSAALAGDVNGDNLLQPIDVLLIINAVSADGQMALMAGDPMDVNVDGWLTLDDASLAMAHLAATMSTASGSPQPTVEPQAYDYDWSDPLNTFAASASSSSMEPSASPSFSFIPSPSYEPTPSPPIEPIPSPTYTPMPSPSSGPMPSPSSGPTPSPSSGPTPSPTYDPTPSLSDEPTPTTSTAPCMESYGGGIAEGIIEGAVGAGVGVVYCGSWWWPGNWWIFGGGSTAPPPPVNPAQAALGKLAWYRMLADKGSKIAACRALEAIAYNSTTPKHLKEEALAAIAIGACR